MLFVSNPEKKIRDYVMSVVTSFEIHFKCPREEEFVGSSSGSTELRKEFPEMGLM
jgi:hypothetical protein